MNKNVEVRDIFKSFVCVGGSKGNIELKMSISLVSSFLIRRPLYFYLKIYIISLLIIDLAYIPFKQFKYLKMSVNLRFE